MSIHTKRYADNCQRDPKWRAQHRIVHNPRANFVYPQPSIKASQRAHVRTNLVRHLVARAVVMGKELAGGG